MIVFGLVKGLTAVSWVSLLLLMVLFLYGVACVFMFRENDPVHFNNLALAMLTLFRVTTLEDWTDVLYINYYGCDRYDSDLYSPAPDSDRARSFSTGWFGQFYRYDCFKPKPQPVLTVVVLLSFVVLSSFTMLSLFIG